MYYLVKATEFYKAHSKNERKIFALAFCTGRLKIRYLKTQSTSEIGLEKN